MKQFKHDMLFKWGNERSRPEQEFKDDKVYSNMKESYIVLATNKKIQGDLEMELQSAYKDKLVRMVKE